MIFFDMLFNLFVFPGFLFAVFLGMFSSWIDRKVTARIQYRVGPPLLQPYYDIRKLFAKEVCIPQNSNPALFILAPIIALAAVTVVAMFTGFIIFAGGFNGDIILIIYLLMIPPLMAVLGAMASGNPLSILGASREIKLFLAYEAVFVLCLLVPVFRARALALEPIMLFQLEKGPLVFSISGIIAFTLSVLVIQAKLGSVPFDIAEAETEIAGGIYMEYSGALLAFWKLSKTILMAVLPALLVMLYMPTFNWVFFAKYIMVVVLLILFKNINPRLRVDNIMKIFWNYLIPLGAIAALLALRGL